MASSIEWLGWLAERPMINKAQGWQLTIFHLTTQGTPYVGGSCCCRLLFMISSFVSAASWRPHPVLDVVLRCHRRGKSTGTHSQCASLFVVHRSRRVARWCNLTHACCCGMLPRLFGTCLPSSIGHRGRSISRTYLGHRRFGSATMYVRGVGWSVPHPGG